MIEEDEPRAIFPREGRHAYSSTSHPIHTGSMSPRSVDKPVGQVVVAYLQMEEELFDGLIDLIGRADGRHWYKI